MATITTEGRIHIEQDFSRYSKIGSRLIGEDGAVWVPASSEGTGGNALPTSQPGLSATELNPGGAIRLIECIGLRPGTTLQGFKSTFNILSEKVYGVHSPSPIYFSGFYLIKASQLPDEFRNVFSQTSDQRGDSTALPKSGKFSANCFRNIVNDHFASAHELIVDESSEATQALLPELVQTMEVVGDDELDLTYDEMIYLITGYYPKDNASMNLTFQKGKGGLVGGSLVSGASVVTLAGHFGAMHNHSYSKNLICIEPSFLIGVAGVWEQPNNDTLYSSAVGAAIRFQGASNTADNNFIDRGQVFEVDRFSTLDEWLADPTSDDPVGALDPAYDSNAGTNRATLNYWLSGEVSFDYDWDPIVVTGEDAGAGVTINAESSSAEGSEAYLSRVQAWTGVSTLQGFPD